MFRDKAQAFRCAKQAAAARQFAQMKANRRFKRDKSTGQTYKPGVSVLGSNPAYSGYPESIRVPHNIKPSRYAGTRRAGRG